MQTGALHHVIVRGIERGKLFRSDYDHINVVNRIRSLIIETQTDSTGGWSGLKGLRKNGIRVKGDECILGHSDFVENVLKSAEEDKYDLKARSYDFDGVTERVAEVMEMEIERVTAFGKSSQTVKARSFYVFGRIEGLA